MGPRQLTQSTRRQFLGATTLLMLAGLGRRLWAQAFSVRFRPLAHAVLVPLETLSTAWGMRQFVADGVTLSSAATPDQPIRISGMIVRTTSPNQSDSFAAVCVRCPHEGCDVEYMRDPNRLPQEVKDEIGRPIEHAIYICPCHNSTFKAEDGTRLSGPAPRGLYRFRVTSVSDTAVEIAEVEEDVLIFV